MWSCDPCRHLAKAVWTEQRYQQLLSSSSSSTAQPSPSNREDSSSANSDSVFAEAQREVSVPIATELAYPADPLDLLFATNFLR